MTITEADIAAGARRISDVLYGRPVDLVGFRQTQDGKPFVEVRDGRAHFIVRERGMELQHTVYDDLGELLYLVAVDETRSIATGWEAESRHTRPADTDEWVVWRAKQLQLMHQLDPVWGERLRAEVRVAAELADVRFEDIDAVVLD